MYRVVEVDTLKYDITPSCTPPHNVNGCFVAAQIERHRHAESEQRYELLQRFNNNVFHPRRLASLKTNNDDSIYVHQKYDDVNFHIKYDFIE